MTEENYLIKTEESESQDREVDRLLGCNLSSFKLKKHRNYHLFSISRSKHLSLSSQGQIPEKLVAGFAPKNRFLPMHFNTNSRNL